MFDEVKRCVDAGSVNCPCLLAQCGECMICSRLAGKDYCDCKWQGICVYNEFVQNGSHTAEHRVSQKFRIQKKIWYEKDLAVMQIEVPRGSAEKASLPGSYVFVRGDGEPVFADMPVSILRTCFEEGTIEIAVKAVGPKSRRLLEADRFVELRGIYRNGLLGAEKLMDSDNKKVLCLTKGIGIAPVANFCRWSDGRSAIDVVADVEKVNRFFVEDSLNGCRVRDLTYGKLSLDDTCCNSQACESICGKNLNDYDVVMICASDYYQKKIDVPAEKAVYSNNFTMCCGEGICGACMSTDLDGNTFRMCKCRQ